MSGSNNDTIAIPLAIEPRMKWLVDNKRFADVVFVVGAEKQMVYAHKNIIASGSPVFEQMFFANHNLKMTGSEPIEVPDLTSTGFINMLKYIYTNVLKDVDLTELVETFMAGDKYQVYNMSETMFSFIKKALNNTSNCCIIYDQLMKFPSDYLSVLLDQVKRIIRCNSTSAFKNKHFVNISQETLVDLLSMEALSIEEIDVLRLCAEWVAEEIKRLNLESNATNKQMVFKPIKKLIRFDKINFGQLRNFNQIKDLLSSDELSSLFLFHLNVSKFSFECNTTRRKLVLRSAYCHLDSMAYRQPPPLQTYSEFSPVFKVKGSIFITNVYTFLPNVEDMEFSIHNMVNGLKVELNYEKLLSDSDSCCYFRFIDVVKIDSATDYKFVFKFRNIEISYRKLSTDTTMIVNSNSLHCYLSSLSDGYHCLKEIDFYQIF